MEKNRMQELAGVQQKKLIVLVGPPSSGKSTYIKNNFNPSEIIVVSRDDIAEQEASKNGLTYDELFMRPTNDSAPSDKYGEIVVSSDGGFGFDKIKDINDRVNSMLYARMISAISSPSKHAIIDMTNMSRKARKNIIKKAGNIPKIAVVFNFQSSGALDIIKMASAKRSELEKAAGRSKTIPSDVYDRMVASYQEPTSDEGFNEIIQYDSIPQLKKFLDEV